MTFSFCHLYTLKIEYFLSHHPLASPLYVYCLPYLIVSHYVLRNDMEPNMRIFKNAWFERFARKNRISDKSLREVVELADKGLISADLGSGVIKQRLARRGGGKSGGYRTIIFYRVAEKAFFIYAYAKNERENITAIEENAFRKAAHHVLNLTDEQLAQLILQGQFTEVPNE